MHKTLDRKIRIRIGKLRWYDVETLPFGNGTWPWMENIVLFIRILKATLQNVDLISWAIELSYTPVPKMGILRVVFLVVFVGKAAQQNQLRTLWCYLTKTQRTATDIIILWALLFKKSPFFTDFFELVGLLLFRRKTYELLSMDTDQYLGLWKLQVGGWLCDQRWENSLILQHIHRRIPYWQPQGCGLYQGSQIRH